MKSSLSSKFAQAHPLESLSLFFFFRSSLASERGHLRPAFFKLTFFGRLAWHMFQVYLRASSNRITEKNQVIDNSRARGKVISPSMISCLALLISFRISLSISCFITSKSPELPFPFTTACVSEGYRVQKWEAQVCAHIFV